MKLVIGNRSLRRRCDFFVGRRLNRGNCDVQFYTIRIIHICIRIPDPFSRTTPCNHWVNCSIFALITRAMNMCLTFRRKVSRFRGIRTFTSTALFRTRVSLKPETFFNVEKDLGTKLVPVLLYALGKCATVSRLFVPSLFIQLRVGRKNGVWSSYF